MVYCGKPSKGCSICRQKKIRCDQAEPTCSNCIKAGKECPGYRNMLDLAFRNESEDVIRKAKAKSRKSPRNPKDASHDPKGVSSHVSIPASSAAASSVAVRSSSSTLASDNQGLPTISEGYHNWLDFDPANQATSSLPFSMQPSIEDTGFNHFIFNFVRLPNGPSHGYFQYVDDMYRDGAFDDTLQAAIIAAGLAGIATKTKSIPLMTRARTEYAIALRKINTALRSPTESLKDSVLSAIIIVAIFETIVGAKQLSLKEWTEHINGAATLVKLRGHDQLKRKSSFRLFLHATAHVMLSCVQRSIPMPTQLIALRAEASKYLKIDPAYHYLRMADEFSIFRSDLKNGAFKDPEVAIERASMLDEKLARSFTDVPSGWLYETVFTDTYCEAVFGGSYDIYYDHWIAHIWNVMRLNRIVLNEAILSQLIRGFNATPPKFTSEEFEKQIQISLDICTQMRDGILRSVPQHLGFVNRKPFTSPFDPNTSSPYVADTTLSSSGFQEFNQTSSFTYFLQGDAFKLPHPTSPVEETLNHNPMHPSTGGEFLIWKLYFAGICCVSKAEHRTYVAKMLDFIGETMGIRAGSNLATFMRVHSIAPPISRNWNGKTINFVPEGKVMNGEQSKRPFAEMMAREEKERVERLRVVREGAERAG